MCVAPRIVNEVSFVMRINREIHFAWGAAFGEVHVSLFVAGAACGEMWNDSRSGKRCNFQ